MDKRLPGHSWKEETYRVVIEKVKEEIIIEQDGFIQYANPKALRDSGYSLEELYSKSFLDFIHPEDIEKVRGIYCALPASRLTGPHLFRILTRSGARWVELDLHEVSWKGKPANLCFFYDVTDRKRFEDAYNYSKSLYQSLIENLPQKIFYKDLNSVYLAVNPAFARDFGAGPEEFVGKSDFDLFPKDLAEKYRADDRRIMSSGVMEEMDESYSAEGERKTIRVLKSPMRDKDGKVTGLYGIFWDITDRVRSEEALRMAEESYRTLADNCHTSIYVVQDGKIRFTNPFLSQYSGFSPEDLLGRSILEFIHPEDRQMVRDKSIQMLKGETRTPYEYRILDKSGQVRWIVETVASIMYEGRRATLGSTMDITDFKSMQKELEETRNMLLQADKLSALGKLSAGVAHEILNPVNILSMRLQLMEMTEPLSDKAKDALNICKAQIERVVKITRDMSQFSRLNRKYVNPGDINQLIIRVLDFTAPRLKIENVDLALDLDPGIAPVKMDKFRVEQVLLNLVNNALDAMSERTARTLEVAAKTEVRDGRRVVRIVFRDSGAGISPENIERIFEPFFTTKEPGKGTGLGLSICYWIVSDHGGRIWAENNEQAGASIFIELPIMPEDQQNTENSKSI